jgi:fibronectin type 3 domain-containing protein
VTTTTATTVYSDPTCASNTLYTYTVVASDAAGNASAPSSSATTTTLVAGVGDIAAPMWATGTPLSATASSSSKISLTWGAATDNVGVSGYNIYRSTSSNGASVKVGTTTTTSYIDTGLTAATTYYYYVTAFDGVPNESLHGNGASATTF